MFSENEEFHLGIGEIPRSTSTSDSGVSEMRFDLGGMNRRDTFQVQRQFTFGDITTRLRVGRGRWSVNARTRGKWLDWNNPLNNDTCDEIPDVFINDKDISIIRKDNRANAPEDYK